MALDILRKLCGVDSTLADNERRKVFSAALVVVSLYGNVAYTLIAANDRLDLLGLNAEAADLYLTVLTSDKLDISALTVTDYVARVVHTELIKRAVLISLGGLVGAVEVAAADLRSGQAVFACGARGKPVVSFIQNIAVYGRDRLANGDVGLPLLDREYADAAAILCGAVAVRYSIADARRLDRGKLFAAHNEQSEGFQLGIILQELHADLRGQQQGGYSDLVKVRRQIVEIHTNLFGNDVNRSADEEGTENVSHIYVEAERRVRRNIIILGVEGVAHTVRVSDYVAVFYLAALGHSGRAGGVEHNEQAVRRGGYRR